MRAHGSCSLPLRGRWPGAARSDEVVPLAYREPCRVGTFLWGCANLPFPTRADFVACSETLVSSFGAARTCRFQRGRTSSPARKLRLLPLGLREPAVPIAGCCAAARELAFSFPFLLFLSAAPGLPPRPAQGLTPPLHPRKGFHPLTRFRWRVPLEQTDTKRIVLRLFFPVLCLYIP